MPTTARAYGPREALLLLTLGGVWGLSFLFIEISLDELRPLWVVSGRCLLGGVTLLAIVHLRGRRLPTTFRLWRHLLLLGTLNNALPWGAVAWAQQSLPSGLTALLMAVVPTSTLVISFLVGQERITPLRLGGLILALGGVATIAVGDIDEPGRLVAILTVVTATLAYATGAVYAKHNVSGVLPPMVLACGQVLGAAVVTTLAALLVEGAAPDVTALSGRVQASMLLVGALGTGLAFLIFYTLVERVGPTNATMVTYLIPVVAVTAGALVLDERLALTAFLGGGLIVTGIAVSQLALVRRR